MKPRVCMTSDWTHQFLPVSCKTLKTSEIVFILLITIVREETLIKAHTMMRPYGKASRRKLAIKIRGKFFFPLVYTHQIIASAFSIQLPVCATAEEM